jgi:hypothetical protein
MNKPFNLADYELEDTSVLTVQHADSKRGDLLGTDGEPVTIELYGSGSRQAVQAALKAGRDAQARLQNIVRGKIDSKAPEKAEEELVDKLVRCTARISPNFPVSPHDLYSNPKLGYIKRQVQAFLDDDANFAKAPSTP